MREILFRGKRLDNSEWVIGKAVMTLDREETHCTKILDFCQVSCLVTTITGETLFRLEGTIVDLKTVGQSAGLTDKNGNKIFEGDIVRLREQKNKKLVIGEIKYKGHGFYLIKNNNGHLFANGLYGVSEVEVIGNIHDNPELLEEKNNNE